MHPSTNVVSLGRGAECRKEWLMAREFENVHICMVSIQQWSGFMPVP